jgi:hypothetical protein
MKSKSLKVEKTAKLNQKEEKSIIFQFGMHRKSFWCSRIEETQQKKVLKC